VGGLKVMEPNWCGSSKDNEHVSFSYSGGRGKFKGEEIFDFDVGF